MRQGVLRTNLFRFDPSELQCAYQYAHCERSRAAWSLLTSAWQKQNRFNLPTTGLVEMLGIVTRGPAWVNPDPGRHHDWPAIITMRPVEVALINQALRLWTLDVLKQIGMSSTDIAENLAVSVSKPVYGHELIENGKEVASLAYLIVPWMASAMMERTPMLSTVPLKLRASSNGTLVAWNNPIVVDTGQRRAIALHCISPSLVLLRGEQSPYIAIRVHLSHILPQWKHATRHTWLSINGTIAHLTIYTRREDDGQFGTHYSGPAARLLSHMGVGPFPELGKGEVVASGSLRPIHAHTPSMPLIANGTGPLFLDQACWHWRRSITSTEAVSTKLVVARLRHSTVTGADVSVSIPPVLALTAHARTAVRLDHARQILAAETYTSFKGGRLPDVDLIHLAPRGADAMLCGPCNSARLEEWYEREVAPQIKISGAGTALVETSIAVAQGKAETDPKFQLRRLFARQGVTTQFIFDAEPKDPDYPANASLIEVVRQSGALPSPMLRLSSLPRDTMVVAVYLDRIKAKGQEVFLPVITRIKIDDGAPEIFWHDVETDSARWIDYRLGTARTHSSTKLLTGDAVKKIVSRALLAPTSSAATPLIIYLHSSLRTIYSGLRDGGGDVLPEVANKSAWIVRIRADSDTAQMSGDHLKHPAEAGYIGQRLGIYQPSNGDGLFYFVSPSNQYGRAISQRHRTRFEVAERSLRDPWQQLGVTEIAIVRAGDFANPTAIAHQSALLCRNAPMWEGNLRLPAPMHMAKQVAQDHPLVEINRRVFA